MRTNNEVSAMEKVVIQIDYKSGKTELAEINLSKYGQVLVELMSDGRVKKVRMVKR